MYIYSRKAYSSFIFILVFFLLAGCGTKEEMVMKKELNLEKVTTKQSDKKIEDKLSTNLSETQTISSSEDIEKEHNDKKLVESNPTAVKDTKSLEIQPSAQPIKDDTIDQEKPSHETSSKSVTKEVEVATVDHNKNPKTNDDIKTPPSIEEKKIVSHPRPSISTINDFLPQNNSDHRTTPITHVVTHFISNAANNQNNPYVLNDIRQIFVKYGVSAHYLIGRNGEIYYLVPENRIAFHAGKGNLAAFPQYKDKLNAFSIGIEIMAIGTETEMSSVIPASVYHSIDTKNIGYTDAQYNSLNLLIDDILKRNPSIKNDRTHIVGHDEYAPDRKSDPGSLFNWGRLGY